LLLVAVCFVVLLAVEALLVAFCFDALVPLVFLVVAVAGLRPRFGGDSDAYSYLSFASLLPASELAFGFLGL
jgi:hypothetical protein